MTYPFFLSRTFRIAMIATVACAGLSACNGMHRESSPEDVQRILNEMKGPDVGTIDEAMITGAKQAEESKNFVNAAQFYKQVVEKNPDSAKYRFKLAESLRRSGEYDEAVIEYKKVIKTGEKDSVLEATEGLGLSQMALGEFDDAGDTLADVMEKDTTRWRTINAIGILFTIKQMYPEARQYFAEAMVQNPKSVSVLNNTGLMEALAEDYDESIRLLQEAGKQSRGDDSMLMKVDMNLALVYAIKGDLNKAQKVAGQHLDESKLLNNMGYYAHLADDDVLAKSYLNMALTSSNKHYEKAWDNLETLNKLIDKAPRKRR